MFQVLEVGCRGETCNCTGFSRKQNVVSAGYGAASPIYPPPGAPRARSSGETLVAAGEIFFHRISHITYFFIKVEKRLKKDPRIQALQNKKIIGPYIYLFEFKKDGLRVYLPSGIPPRDSKYFSFPEKLSGIWMLGLKDNKFFVNNPQAYTNESIEKVEAILKKQNPLKQQNIQKQQFFPKGLLSSSKNHWYSGILSSAQEPSLYLKAQNASNESYRFIYHQSFNLCPELIIRLNKVSHEYRFSCKGTGKI